MSSCRRRVPSGRSCTPINTRVLVQCRLLASLFTGDACKERSPDRSGQGRTEEGGLQQDGHCARVQQRLNGAPLVRIENRACTQEYLPQ